jgi:hypothetical protein
LPSTSNLALVKLCCVDDDRHRAISRPRAGRVHSPIEVALVQRDEVVSLLAALGASVDMSFNPPYQPNMTLLQWTSLMLAQLQTISGPRSVPVPTQEYPIGDTWAQYNAYLAAVQTTKKEPDSGISK